MRTGRLAAIFGAILCMAAVADPGERLANPAQEARARTLFRETRCLVCQGESIDESEAPLAADLRRVIREQVASGATDGEVRHFLAARYGDFVLFRPPLNLANALLWAAPFLVAFIGAGLLVGRQLAPQASNPGLTPEEESRLSELKPSTDNLAPELRSKNAAGLTET